MKKTITKVRGFRLEIKILEDLQTVANKTENGNLNHLVTKILLTFLKKQK